MSSPFSIIYAINFFSFGKNDAITAPNKGNSERIVNTVDTPNTSEILPMKTEPIPPAPTPNPMDNPEARAKFFGNNCCIYTTLIENEDKTVKPNSNNTSTAKNP